MARNLLHKDKLEAFLQWCKANDIDYRPGVGQYQVAQIKPLKKRDQWEAIYSRLDMPEHLTVTAGLERTVRRFIDSSKRETRRQRHVAALTDAVSGVGDQGAGEPGRGKGGPQKARLLQPPR